MSAPVYDPWDHLRLRLVVWLRQEFGGYVEDSSPGGEPPLSFWEDEADVLIDQLRIFGVTL